MRAHWIYLITRHAKIAGMQNSPKKLEPKQLIIASRESALAMWQAKHIQARLQTLYPNCDVQILGMTTTGDQILD